MVDVRHSLLRSHVESREHVGKEIKLPALDEVLTQLAAKDLNNNRLPVMVRGYFEDMNLVIKNMALLFGPAVVLPFSRCQCSVRWRKRPCRSDALGLAAGHGLNTEDIWVTRFKGNSSQQMAIYGRRPVRESIVFGRRMADFVHNELTERYLKRSALFWKFTRDAKLARLQKEARSALEEPDLNSERSWNFD